MFVMVINTIYHIVIKEFGTNDLNIPDVYNWIFCVSFGTEFYTYGWSIYGSAPTLVKV